MNKIKLYIFLLFICCSPYLSAQETIQGKIENQPLEILLNLIEEQTEYKIFCDPIWSDSIMVNQTFQNESALQILQQAIKDTELQISIFQNKYIFLSLQQKMLTWLPEKNRQENEPYIDLFGNRKNQKATSENKIYEVGDPPTQNRQVQITGKITDFKTGEAMQGINVILRDPWSATTTDRHGNFSLVLPTGRVTLTISGFGIKETRRQLLIHGEGNIDIELEEQSYALEEVTVTSGRIQNIQDTRIGIEKFNIREIKNIPMAFGEIDILRVVQSLPGVKTVGEASSGFNVRGGSTDQNLILFNDGTIYNPSHLFGFFSAFNSDMIKEAELYKSSIPAQYGGRISSVLDINSREGDKEKFTGSAGIGVLTSRLTLEGPIIKEKTSLLVSGRTTYSDWIMKKLPEKSGYKNGKAGFYDIGGVLSHKFSNNDNVYINGYYSHDNFQFNEDDKYNYSNMNLSGKWRHIFNDKFYGTLTAGYDHYDYETTSTENKASGYKLAFDINQWFGKVDFSYNLTETNVLNFGASNLFYNINPGTYTPADQESLVVPDALQKEKALESAIYIGDEWEITPKLSVNVGIRYSIFNALGERNTYTYPSDQLPEEGNVLDTIYTPKGKTIKTYHGPEFRFSTRYILNENLSIKGGINSMRQYIHKISNTTIMSPTDTWKLSDANIKPQTGIQYAAGIYWNTPNQQYETSIEGYYKKMNDYLDYRSGAKLIMNHHLETDVMSTEGKAYGIEFMIKKPEGKLNGWMSYSYSRTKLRQNDARIDKPINDGKWYSAEYDKPHDLKLVGNYKFTQRYSLSFNCDYSTGRPITLPSAKYYDHELGTEMVYYSKRNSHRISDYFRLDLAFNIEPSHKLTLLTHSSLSFGVYNVTGRKNIYSVYYVTENGAIQGYQMSIFGIPIPYITYNIKF